MRVAASRMGEPGSNRIALVRRETDACAGHSSLATIRRAGSSRPANPDRQGLWPRAAGLVGNWLSQRQVMRQIVDHGLETVAIRPWPPPAPTAPHEQSAQTLAQLQAILPIPHPCLPTVESCGRRRKSSRPGYGKAPRNLHVYKSHIHPPVCGKSGRSVETLPERRGAGTVRPDDAPATTRSGESCGHS